MKEEPFLVNLNRRDAATTLAVSLHSIAGLSSGNKFKRELSTLSHIHRCGRGSLGELFTLADTSQTHTADSSPTAPSTRRQGPPAPPHRLTRPRRCHGPTYREKTRRAARAGGGPAGRQGRGLGLAHTPHMRHVTSESGLPHAHPRGARVSSPWQRRVGGLLKVNFES